MPISKDRVRVVLLLHKRDDISKEEFQRYWNEEHADVLSDLSVVKKNLLKYEQVSDICIKAEYSYKVDFLDVYRS